MEVFCPITVDYAGKTYNTIKISDQCWLKENLDVGTMIDGTTSQTNNGMVEKFCYDDDITNCDAYGGLYQWEEAMQYTTTPGTQGICPSGWHIPTYAEFQTLIRAVNGDGRALKAIGQGVGDGAGTNTSGFSALLSGYQRHDGAYLHLGYYTYFWSSIEYNDIVANYLHLSHNNNFIYFYYGYKKSVISVRCLQD